MGWLAQFATLSWIYALGGAPRRGALLYPVGCWIVAGAMWDGASDLVLGSDRVHVVEGPDLGIAVRDHGVAVAFDRHGEQ